MTNKSLLTLTAQIWWGGGEGIFPGVKFLGSFRKMSLEKHINPDFILKNVDDNLQVNVH